MISEIQRLLKVGDKVYSAIDGSEMTVTQVFARGFMVDDDYYYFHEVRERYFLTQKVYELAKAGEG